MRASPQGAEFEKGDCDEEIDDGLFQRSRIRKFLSGLKIRKVKLNHVPLSLIYSFR